MAEEDIEVVEEKKGNSKLLIIIIGVLVLVLIGLGAMMFLGGGDKPTEGEETAEEVEPVKQKAIYQAVEKPFIVNFSDQSKGAVRYMQIKLKVMARSQDVIDAFILHEPAIKHELLLLFYSQNYDELNTNEGTQALRKAALATINEILKQDTADAGLENVYFTSLIMQ
jgi:flagellar FliL protein